ncbi:competence protein CoiA family protein [Dolichospermum heterosporum]|uniref:Competence protein CoiA-like N-terminal domain-containing protein n=1 Tax=Dolichospermum heterosporum TAC447 TaxID=747523 RepID=A0ABY5LRF9_9CYAN|nr:hypothetical protein [Dolichospermum heterosporum]UUO14543.1 hypothetical protein NG743_21310 [Dolichospermum heterosporum TAC447]
MDIARAMYLGGTTIRASEGNYSSYDKKGLLCCFCGEPVYLKKGDIRKPHFAHFPGTDPKQVEECELRASSYGNSSQLNSFIKDRGQRLKIFQQHFLNLISFEGDKPTTNLDFNNWINSIKRDHSTVIDIIVNDCTDYFIRNCHQIAAKYIKQITNNDNKPILIQQEIALEAISYLCVKSSCKLIKYLLHYGIYKLFKHEISNLFKDEVKTQNVDNICHLVIKIIVLNIWTEALNEVESNNIKIQSQTKLSSQLYELSNASQFCVSYTVMGGKKGNVPIVYTLEAINGKLLIYFHSTVAVKNEVTGKTDNVHNKLEVGEIKAVPGSLYIDLKQDLLPNKLIFDDYNFHCELLVNYALPDWISRSADLVESNKIAPVWLIVSKLIILTCYDEITNELSINETNTVKTFNVVQWWEILLDSAKECPTVLQFQNAAKLNQQMAVITKQTSTGKTDIYFFLSSIDGNMIRLRNDKKNVLDMRLDLSLGLYYETPLMKDSNPNVDLINLISDISKNTDKLDTSLGLDWLVVAFKVYQVVIMRRVDAVSTEIVNATIKDWIAAIKSVTDINNAIVITDFLLNKSFMGSRLNSSEKTSLNQVLTKLKNSLQSEQSQNKLKHTVDAVNVTNITNNTTQKLTKENRNKWRKPSYVKSLLQRLKDNPLVRSNQFQGVDYFVSKCVITIPENNTKLADKIRQFLSFEVEKISVDIPENIRQDYDGKMKTTIRYDCDDQVLLNLVTEQYTNNERSIWNVKHNPDNYSIDVSLKLNVSKLSFKQLNIMYKKANKYYESISHDTIFSILDMLVLDKSELIKISRTPLIIAFNILLSLDPVIDYYQFIKQIRVDTVNGDLMSCISLPTIDVKTSRIIMIPDLNLFNEMSHLTPVGTMLIVGNTKIFKV